MSQHTIRYSMRFGDDNVRPLAEAERAILMRLLRPELDDVRILQQQAEVAECVEIGPYSIRFVLPNEVPRGVISDPSPVAAGDCMIGSQIAVVHLFVHDGLLSTLERAWVGEGQRLIPEAADYTVYIEKAGVGQIKSMGRRPVTDSAMRLFVPKVADTTDVNIWPEKFDK